MKSEKILHILEKPKAKTYYKIVEDKDDPWFIYIQKIDKKTKEIQKNSMIIAKDLESQLKLIKSDGWEETSEEQLTYNIKNQQDRK
jgi:hypothetical protein